MKCQNKDYYFDVANEGDDASILEILEQPDFEGNIGVMYTRRPSPVYSMNQSGERVCALVCRLVETEAVVAVGLCAVHKGTVRGVKKEIAYISALRVKASYRMRPSLLVDGYGFMMEWISNQGITEIYTTILEDNTKVQKMFEKKRTYFPYYYHVADYTVFCGSIKQKRISETEFVYTKAAISDIDEMLKLVESHKQRYDLTTLLTRADLLGESFKALKLTDFYLARKKATGELCGFCYPWYQSHYKQHILHHYGGLYKLLSYIGFLLPMFGYPKLPKVGTVMDYYTLSFCTYKETEMMAMDGLIKTITKEHKKAHYFLLGLASDDPLCDLVKKRTKITYKSRLYLVDYQKTAQSEGYLNQIQKVYAECGML